jgi:hypothetical protein
VEQDYDRRAPVNLLLVEEKIKSSYPGDLLEDMESIPSSMTHSLDSESDPPYAPFSDIHSTSGSDFYLSCHVDMEPAEDDIPIPVVFGASGSFANISDPRDVGGSEVIVRGAG